MYLLTQKLNVSVLETRGTAPNEIDKISSETPLASNTNRTTANVA